MCGIAGGAWTSPAGDLDDETLDRMTDALRHRGPDDRGTYRRRHEDGSGVGLGHRRLSIIDLGGGHQPLSNEDGSVWIVFNGEIYNYVELRADLIARGHQFHTNSDTETIVHLYEQYGTDCLAHLRGMFAFAIWDERRRTLFLARDRMGQKPLVYMHSKDRFIFASEIKALLEVADAPREVNEQSLDAYLTYLYVPHPETMFRGILKLPPAHFATYQDGRLNIERYWTVDWQRESNLPAVDLCEQLRERLDEAVRLRLRSDVPIGAFLSGGVDSTTIVALMQRHLPTPARTFTIAFPFAEYDEAPFARQVAENLQTAHQELLANPEHANLLPTLCWLFDEPFGDSSAIPTYLVSQVTREHVKVALTGDGGDELFCGYPRYKTVQRVAAFDRLPRALVRALTGSLWDRAPDGDGNRSFSRRLRYRIQALREPPDRRYVKWVMQFDRSSRRALYAPALLERVQDCEPESFVIDAVRRSSLRAPGTQAMMADLQTYLPCDLLVKLDMASMAHALECRSPFMDHHVVEMAAAIPFKYHVRRNTVKPMLTDAMAGIIPHAIVNRPKMGFSVPLDRWFRGALKPLVRDLLLGREFAERGYFQRTAISRIVDEHLAGTSDYSQQIWSLMCLEQWHRTYLDSVARPRHTSDWTSAPCGAGDGLTTEGNHA